MKLKYLIKWFFHCDYWSGEMIRTWLHINGFLKIETMWKKHMIRRINGLH